MEPIFTAYFDKYLINNIVNDIHYKIFVIYIGYILRYIVTICLDTRLKHKERKHGECNILINLKDIDSIYEQSKLQNGFLSYFSV